jgi:hypothetical protein
MSALLLENKIKEFKKSKDDLVRHKALLDFGESLIIYCEGMLFGEYRKAGLQIDQIERSLYNCATRPASLGVHWGFVRDLTRNLPESLLGQKFPVKEQLPECSLAVFKFSLLKGAILNKDPELRINTDLHAQVEALAKGRNAPQSGKLAFFNDCFISVRNTFAHPDQVIKKTGEVVNWPLTEEYFLFINPLLENALLEVYEELKPVFFQYPPAQIEIQEVKGQMLTCQVVFDEKTEFENFTIQLDDSVDEDEIVFIDYKNQELYVQNYSRPPQVSSEMALKIAKDEKKKQIVKVLEPLIDKCLLDEELDTSEYFSLKMTAESGYIDEDELKDLIGKVRQKRGLTPQFEVIDSSGDNLLQRFNPWWLKYLSIRGFLKEASVVEKGEDQTVGTKTYVHASLFREFKDYVQFILSESLDKGATDPAWGVKMNNWQQGRMTGYLWARVAPLVSPIDTAYAIILYVPTEGDRLSSVIAEDRGRLQLFLRHQDSDANLLKETSEIIAKFIQTNSKKLLEMNADVGVFPRKWLGYKFFRDDFDAMGGFDNAVKIKVEDYLNDKERYEQKYCIGWLGLPALTENDYYLNDVNFDKALQAGFSTYGSIISRIADFALISGLSVSEAQRKSRIYSRNLDGVLKNLKNQFFELVENETIETQDLKSWQNDAQAHLLYSDYEKLMNELRGSVACPDMLALREISDEDLLSAASNSSDQIRNEFQSAFLSCDISKPEKRPSNLKSYGIYGDMVTLIPKALWVTLGVTLHADGCVRAACAIAGDSKNMKIAQTVDSWVFESEEWHFENSKGDKLLRSNSGRGGMFTAVYRKDSDGMEAIVSCLNQLIGFSKKNGSGVV